MKEKPILFKGEMVRAILEGRKTQTRRMMKVQPESVEYYLNGQVMASDSCRGIPTMRDKSGKGWATCGPFKCPFIADGMFAGEYGKLENSHIDDTTERRSILWVKETWRPQDGMTLECRHKDEIAYRATDDRPKESTDCHWKPSIFMPRWASRLTLEITSIRIERLLDISEEDAIAEGIRLLPGTGYGTDEPFSPYKTAKSAYLDLWERINGKESVKQNPWLWVITFNKIAQ